MEPKEFKERNMLVIYRGENNAGVACVEVETNHIYIEQLDGEPDHLLH